MSLVEQIADWTTRRRLATIALMIVLTMAIGYGAVNIEQETDLGQFETESVEAEKLEYINENFGEEDEEATTAVQIIVRGDNVLARESLIETVELQRSFTEDDLIGDTLTQQPFTDIGSAVATTLVRQRLAAQAQELPPEERAAELTRIQSYEPTYDEQVEALESADEAELETVIHQLFTSEESRGLLALMPTDYEPGAPESDARVLVVTQLIEDEFVAEGDAPEIIVESQLRMNELVGDRFGDDGFVFGQGIITNELNRSLEDSLTLVIPFALLLVVVTLMIAYRDLLDILLGVVGIVTVLIWTFGFMGWAGIDFNQIFIAVPVLLIGLSIDYAIHVFMRQREHRQDHAVQSGRAMYLALVGLLVALTWVTATAVFGFLANVISPIQPVQEFGIVSAFGIIAALLIFGLLVPAIKVTLDDWLEGHGIDRQRRAFGTGGGAFTGVLAVGERLARRAPVVVIVLALVVTAGGVYGASQIDTSFEVEDFIADEPAAWTDNLPEPFRPGEYATKSNLELIDDRFLRQDLRAQLLFEGDVTDDGALERVETATADAGARSVTVTLGDGRADVTSPLTVMRAVAAEDPGFNATFTAADTNGDGVPDRDLEGVYDAFFAAAPEQAANVIHRTEDGEYEGLLMTVSIQGSASTDAVTDQMSAVAAAVDGDGIEVTATGQLIVFSIIEDELFDAVFNSLLISLVAVFLFLMVVYRLTEKSAILGLVTLFPIGLAVAWILGTMYLLDIPFNVVTGTITSLTIGLGVAYNIHMSERFRFELRRGREVWDAMYVSVTGTGGALLGSAATTAGGFGVLAIAIIPILQQFGIITAITIIYAFLASVLVLPTLLILWLRYFAPDRYADATSANADAPVERR